MHQASDLFWMREAIRLARLGEGLTRPNPPVGALVVKSGRVLGKGYHRKAGGPHAEVYALRRAARAAHGGTLYVTLEPCCSWGRTPPCTDAIIAAGIRRVVAAVTDPNPCHSGRGFRLLRSAGIQVDVGICRREAELLVGPFTRRMLYGRPEVILKLAVSLDGRIADASGHSKWISGSSSRKQVQELRSRCDAVLVGSGTVMADDPSLLPRPSRGRKPLRIVVDSRGHVSPSARVFQGQEYGQTILATTRRCPGQRRRAYESAGGQVWVLPGAENGVSLPALLKKLADAGAMRVMVEGGGILSESLLKARLVDEVILFAAPLILGRSGVSCVGGSGWSLARAPRLNLLECKPSGGDLMLRYAVRR